MPTTSPVLLSARDEAAGPPELAGVAERTGALAGQGITAAVAWAAEIGAGIPMPAAGRTLRRWEVLATAGAHDLTVARVLEPHLDALAILHEEGTASPPDSSWGVYAAEGPGVRLEARLDADRDTWVLRGRKPWCSLAGAVSHALITAWVDEHERVLFAVDLRHPQVTVDDASGWVPAGLSDVVTTAVTLDGVPARPVGGPGWYLRRDGFAWGGIGVAAVWYGGAVGLARRLAEQADVREPDQIGLMHLGAVDAALAGARAVLAESAALIDAPDGPDVTGAAAALLAARVRHVVALAAETVLARVAHALGPGPLSQEPAHARRVADLSLYLRQHHAERDEAAAGRLVLDAGGAPW